jgi:tetratricopeptide (TPR) repeat protein
MMEINQLKGSGMNKLMAGKYQQAINDFTQIIDKVKATSEDRIAIKIFAFSQRSYCNIMLKSYEKAMEDVNQAIEIAESARKEKDIQGMSETARQEDAIIPLLVESLVRRGNIYDLTDYCLEALKEYKAALNILPNSDAKSAYEKLLRSCGVPSLKKDNEKLKVFVEIVENILNRGELLNKLNALIAFFGKDNEIPKPDIEFYASSKAINVPDGVLTIYVRDRDVVLTCLKAIYAIGEKKCLPVFAFFEDVKDCIARYSKDAEIVTEALGILYDTPEEAFNKFANEEAIDPIIETLSLNLPEEVEEKVFFILFNIASNDAKVIAECNNPLVLETIEKKKNVGAAILMSRLEQCKGFALFAFQKIGMRWMTDLLNENLPKEKLICILIAVTRALLFMSDVEELNTAEEANAAIEKIIPILTKHLKSSDIASNSFAALALCAEFAPEKIRQVRALQLASLGIVIHAKVENAVQNIISFVYGCSMYNLLNDIKETGTLVSSALAVIREFPTKEPICERAIALAVKTDHPAKKDLLIAGLKQFPDSKILKDLIPSTIDFKA